MALRATHVARCRRGAGSVIRPNTIFVCMPASPSPPTRPPHHRSISPCGARLQVQGTSPASSYNSRVVFDTEAPQGVLLNEPLSNYCTFGIGGPARYLHVARDAQSIQRLVRWASSQGLPVRVIGRGSNCLFDDRGYSGLIIVNRIDFIHDLGDGCFRVGSGRKFNSLGMWTAVKGWGGLEFAVGIPGTAGGAAFMNAGAHGQSAGAVLIAAEALHADGSCETIDLQEGSESKRLFGYRTSPLQLLPRTSAIVALTFKLRPDPEALGRAKDSLARRKATQPLHDMSAGCVFRNPSATQQGQYPTAGQLIDSLGFKGFQVGGAAVSLAHANFFINKEGSRSSDMHRLIQLVKERVEEEKGIRLEEEISYVPFSG